MKPKPVLSFRAKPSRSSRLYFEVHIFANLRELRRYCRSCDPPLRGKTAGAFRPARTTVFTKNGRQRTRPRMGEIILSADRLAVPIVTHECMHAALWWARRRGIDIEAGMPAEERACYALSSFSRTIYRRVFDAGLLEESQAVKRLPQKRAA